jgi:hypothetical protein
MQSKLDIYHEFHLLCAKLRHEIPKIKKVNIVGNQQLPEMKLRTLNRKLPLILKFLGGLKLLANTVPYESKSRTLLSHPRL